MREQLRRSGAAQHRQLSFVQTGDSPLEVNKEEMKVREGKDVNIDIDTIDQPNISVEEERHKYIQEVMEKYWNLAKNTVNFIVEIFWRLLEIYLPKAIIFVLFAAILDEISATHFLILAILPHIS